MPVKIVQYKWAGKLGPFSIKSKCQECDLTTNIIKNMMSKEFKGKGVTFEVKPWLDNFFYCLFRLSWHAPIIIVDGKKFYQYNHKYPLFDRKKLESLVLKQQYSTPL
jgi:hypothetical protein